MVVGEDVCVGGGCVVVGGEVGEEGRIGGGDCEGGEVVGGEGEGGVDVG